MINGLRVAAVMPLHFGLAYVPYAMRSVADVVDEYLIMYSPVPNHGTYSSPIPCPETRDMLMEAAYLAAPDKTRWFEWDGWKSEGEQFKSGWQYTDADVIVKLDCDEIWHPSLLSDAVKFANKYHAPEIRVPLRHYWRSFRKAFTNDPAAPGRIYLRQNTGSHDLTFFHADPYRIHHMGYALPVEITRYKMGIHGHLREFKNPNWFNEVWLANRQTDCHPIGSDYWMETETVDVPEFMQDHPFANLEVIE